MKALANVFLGVMVAFLIPTVTPAFAKADTTCGTVEVSKGDIKIQSGKTKQLAPAPAGSPICSGDTIIAGAESRAKLKMPDGNELNISPNSKIVIENYQFNPAENKKKVLLNIMQGKVRAATKQENMYNDKDKNGQANTFQVRTKSAVAGVRGTDFLTSFDPKTLKSEVVTFKGKVEFGQPGPGGSIINSVQVGAGFKTEATAGQPPAPPAAVPSAELERANSETKADVSSSQKSEPNANASSSEGEKSDDSKSEAKQEASSEQKQASEDKKADEPKEEPKKEEPKKAVASEEKKSEEPKKEEPRKEEPKKAVASEEKKPEEPKKTAGADEKKQPGDNRRPEPASQQQAQRPGSAETNSGSTPGNTTAQTAITTSPGATVRAPAAVPPPTMINTTELTGGTGFAGPALPTNTTLPTVYVPPPPPIIQPVVPVCDLCNQVIQNTPSKTTISVQLPTTTQ